MKMTYAQVEAIFGRGFVEPDDSVSVNDKLYAVKSAGPEGVEFEEQEEEEEE